jgi:hypothetical protein
MWQRDQDALHRMVLFRKHTFDTKVYLAESLLSLMLSSLAEEQENGKKELELGW